MTFNANGEGWGGFEASRVREIPATGDMGRQDEGSLGFDTLNSTFEIVLARSIYTSHISMQSSQSFVLSFNLTLNRRSYKLDRVLRCFLFGFNFSSANFTLKSSFKKIWYALSSVASIRFYTCKYEKKSLKSNPIVAAFDNIRISVVVPYLSSATTIRMSQNLYVYRSHPRSPLASYISIPGGYASLRVIREHHFSNSKRHMYMICVYILNIICKLGARPECFFFILFFCHKQSDTRTLYITSNFRRSWRTGQREMLWCI